MPLESLPDPFEDVTHQELDRAVNEAASRGLSGPLISPIQYYYLFNHIVGYLPKDDLDTKYLLGREAETLIDNCGELRDMLSSAWERKSYREIRNLGVRLLSISIIHLSSIMVDYAATTNSDALPGSHSEKANVTPVGAAVIVPTTFVSEYPEGQPFPFASFSGTTALNRSQSYIVDHQNLSKQSTMVPLSKIFTIT